MLTERVEEGVSQHSERLLEAAPHTVVGQQHRSVKLHLVLLKDDLRHRAESLAIELGFDILFGADGVPRKGIKQNKHQTESRPVKRPFQRRAFISRAV